eukprot:m.271211 g.271211  ORF g.271211 m.271211 type:complete len:136 (-) comp16268_c1_seq4:1060-1467(-)
MMEETFFACKKFAVAGASTNRNKFGNKVFRALLGAKGEEAVIPVHPKEPVVEGVATQPIEKVLAEENAEELGLSIVTPPAVSLDIVQKAIDAGVRNIWLQPGAESQAVLDLAKERGVPVISSGYVSIFTSRLKVY